MRGEPPALGVPAGAGRALPPACLAPCLNSAIANPSLPRCPWSSRPTAVNLSIAAEALKALAAERAAAEGATAASVTGAVVDACEAMLHDDVAANKVGTGVWQMAPLA